MMKALLKKIILKYKYKECNLNTTQIHQNAHLGKGVKLAKDVSIGNGVSIGDYTYINNFSTISSANIGSYCSIGAFCIIGPDSHPIDWISTSPNFYRNFCSNKESGYVELKKAPIIGNDVWIGARVIIMRGIVIGDGSILAAGSVITKDVLPYSIVGGVPAKHLRFRFEKEVINKLLERDIWEDGYPINQLNELADTKELFKDYL
jgi:virginiamycin A acetyltransferase